MIEEVLLPQLSIAIDSATIVAATQTKSTTKLCVNSSLAPVFSGFEISEQHGESKRSVLSWLSHGSQELVKILEIVKDRVKNLPMLDEETRPDSVETRPSEL